MADELDRLLDERDAMQRELRQTRWELRRMREMATVREQQVEEIRQSMHVIYQSNSLVVRAFSLPQAVKNEVTQILHERRQRRKMLGRK